MEDRKWRLYFLPRRPNNMAKAMPRKPRIIEPIPASMEEIAWSLPVFKVLTTHPFWIVKHVIPNRFY